MSTTSRGLLLTEKDGSWGTGVEPVLPPSGASDSVWLTSVSCASAGNCSAVGGYADNAGHEGLLLSETAGTWKTGVKAALPPHVDQLNYVSLNSVSCPSAGNCTTGSYQQGADSIVLLTERGGKWAPGVEAAVPARDAPVFSCPSVGNCGAIASDGSGSGLLLTETAGRWDTAIAASLPSNASGQADLTSVSCAFAGYCSAVGSYEDTSGVWQGLLLSSTPVSLKPCRVPRLKGKTLTAARQSIKSHDCSVGKIKHATSRKVTRGHVMSQKPQPGTQLKHGAKVNLVISKGQTP